MNNEGRWTRRLLITIVCGLFVVALSSFSQAEIPKKIGFQGKLTDAQGNLLDGTYSLTFKIYNAETGGTKLWEETQSVSVSEGLFSVYLGDSATLNLDFDEPYWLEITVEGEILSPRKQIAASGYAYNATKLDDLDSSQFLRSDYHDTMNGNLTIQNAKLEVIDGTAPTWTHSIGSGDLAVENDIEIDGTIYGDSNLSVAGNTTITGNLTVSGTTNLSTTAISGTTSDSFEIDTDDSSTTPTLTFGANAAAVPRITTQVGDLELYPAGEDVNVYAQNGLKVINDATATDNITIRHDDTDGVISTSTGNIKLDSNGGTIDIDDGTIDLSTQTVDVTLNNAADALNFDSNTLSIDALNGRVGIGTNSPEETLQVGQDAANFGNVRVTGDDVAGYWATEANPRWELNRDMGGAGNAGIGFGPGGATALDTKIYRTGAYQLRTTAYQLDRDVDDSYFKFIAGTSNSTAASWEIYGPDNNGNEGRFRILIPNPANAKGFDIMRAGDWASILTIDPQGATVFNVEADNDADFQVKGDTDDNTFYVDTSADSVGIGQAAPGAKLEVEVADTANKIGLLVDQNDVTNNPVALQVENAGTGNGIYVSQTGNGIGLNVATTGTDNAATFDVNNASNLDYAVAITTNGGNASEGLNVNHNGTGTGNVAAFIADNTSGSQVGVYIRTDGTGNTLYAKANNAPGAATAAGHAGYFWTAGANNSDATVYIKGGGTSATYSILQCVDSNEAAAFEVRQNKDVFVYGWLKLKNYLNFESDNMVLGRWDSGTLNIGNTRGGGTGGVTINLGKETNDIINLNISGVTYNFKTLSSSGTDDIFLDPAGGDVAIDSGDRITFDNNDTDETAKDTYITHNDAGNYLSVVVDGTESARFYSTGKFGVNVLDGGADPAQAEVTLFDDYDDIQLLRYYIYGEYDKLPQSIYENGFVDEKNLKQLIGGAIFQMEERISKLEKKLEALERKL
jgi:hypothetical protein